MDVLTRGLAPDKLGRVWEEELTIARRSEEHTSELQSLRHLVCRLLLEKKKKYSRPSRITSPPISEHLASTAWSARCSSAIEPLTRNRASPYTRTHRSEDHYLHSFGPRY